MKEICRHDSCTGCKACMSSCSRSSISFRNDEYGFWYPVVDQSTCVDCGLCAKTCPSNYSPEEHRPIVSLIGHARDIGEQKTSTSGGLASALCRYALRQGYIVYGCTSTDYPKIHHIRVDNEKNLALLKGSKYVQSDVEDVFIKIKQDLKDHKVVFVGTPCQCAGLKNYIKKGKENLLLIDFVCHGVPSQKILSDAIRSVDKGKAISNVEFRKKINDGESRYGLFLTGKDGKKVYEGLYPKDDYIVTFLSGLFYRPSCYECNYAKIERCSDITLGDYWDRDKEFKPENNGHGLSMIMANTEKGKKFLEESSYLLNAIAGDTAEFVRRNGQLDHPMKKHKMYEEFHNAYKTSGWAGTIPIINLEKKRLKKAFFINSVRDFLLSIPGMSALLNLKKRFLK